MERQAFLTRISARLGRPAHGSPPERTISSLPEPLEVLAGRSQPPPADPALRFKAELERVGGEVRIAEDLTAAHAALSAELERWGAERMVSWARSEFSPWQLDWLWSERRAQAFGEPPLDSEAALKQALIDSQIGVTVVDYAISGTGSLVLSASPARPRGVSLLPAVHIALVRESQLRSRIGAALSAFAALELDGLPSAVHFITGPSRTSDIENDLTIGVHGPAAVSVILWRDGPLAGEQSS